MTLKLYGLNQQKENQAEIYVVQCLGVIHFTLNDDPRKPLELITSVIRPHGKCKIV